MKPCPTNHACHFTGAMFDMSDELNTLRARIAEATECLQHVVLPASISDEQAGYILGALCALLGLEPVEPSAPAEVTPQRTAATKEAL